jgi:hypothetical protein
VTLELKAQQVHKAPLARKALQVTQVLKDYQVTLVHKD